MPLEQDSPEESYGSYDPTTVRPSLPDPSQSSEAPGGAESHDGTDVSGEGVAEPTKAKLPEFDPRHREPFQGLMFLGALSKTYTWLGHKFEIRTLTTEEVLAVALITAKYESTMGSQRAYVTAVVALAVQTVDDEHLPFPYKKDDLGNAYAEGRFNYVKANWFPYTIDAIYTEYLVLENTVREVFAEMGNASG